ncbi:hypothetical protein DVY02_12765 [Enterococcus faecium]|nr:hypothetical protein DVW90_12735 [Enterococcus faecium]TKN81509.1 hypothetical protein DVX12_12815 [Enterococcus faecium]TKO40919.1 hypothetical protein DVY02_12765 [Enterococcus faecium]
MCLLWSSKLQLSHHVSTRAHRHAERRSKTLQRREVSEGTAGAQERSHKQPEPIRAAEKARQGQEQHKNLTSALRQLSIQKFSLRLKGVKILFFLNFHKGLQILFFGSLCQCVQIGQVCI